MKRTSQLCALLLAAACALIGQVPTGTITGTVMDESGAVVAGAPITITNKDTGAARSLTSAADGVFTASALPAGKYEVRATMEGFRTMVTEATVETGATANADMRLQVGQTKDIVNVEAATSTVEYQRHTIDGVITRQQIQELPLNGRSFLNLAMLEPGVTVSPGTTSQYNSLFQVSILGGAENKTAITVDGGNIRNSIEGNSGMNFSQEVVQEFQLSSANFDLSTSITSVGSVNVVTRSGSNDFHGSAYFYFRDHNMSAYPGLRRNALNPDPFFVRRNPGFWVGGPIVKNRLFFFFNYEYLNQTQVFTYVPNLASASALTGNYLSPYKGKNLSFKFDYNLSSKHHLMGRYSHDGNSGFGPNGGAVPPSNWLRNTNWSDQSVLSLTSAMTATLVNDFRFSYQYWQNRNLFPNAEVCPGCLGLNFPQVQINGTNVTIGNTSNATQGRDLRKFQFNEALNWQKGAHGLKFGMEYEHAPGTGFWGFCDPSCAVVAAPELVRANVPPALVRALFPTLPTTISTEQDFLNLPFLGGVVGIGDPSQPPPYNVGEAKINNRMRFFAQDQWRISSGFSLNYGVAWNFESTLVNRDLSKPALLAPLYGSDLSPTNNNYGNWSPSIGFAWTVDKSQKTVIRGGFGIYYDTELLWRRLQERAYTGPVGNGRIQYPTSGFKNIFPGVVSISQGGKPIPVGAPLPSGELMNLTLAQYLQIQNQQAPIVAAALAPKDLNDLSVRNIDISKAGAQMYPKDYPVQHSLQFNIGVQRQLRDDAVIQVDFVRRVFLNTLLGEVDYNRWDRFINGARAPVIPACTGSQASIVGFNCSTGPMTFWTPGGREVYNGLLAKFDKRFAHRWQFLASYALTDRHGYSSPSGSPVVNMDQWNAGWGPLGVRHILNLSGIVDLPWGFQIGLISTTSSRGPATPWITGVDLTGNGVTTTALPGIPINGLNRGYGQEDMTTAVASWNQTYAGKKDARGKTIPSLVLPSNYDLGASFNSQDLRVTKKFTFKERYQFSIFGEVFNVLNIGNVSGFGFNVDQATPTNQTYNFGIPTQRVGQVFGSGGPRAFQLGGRFQF